MREQPERQRRARIFGSVAGEYAQHRPGYPAAAVAWALEPVAGRPAPHLLDLAAGTGKLTGSLLAVPGATVTAVEPDPGMLAELRSRFAGARAVAGSAEAIPVPDGSVDAVTVGTAWHWFDPPRALAEIARVLRPGGVLTALWNNDDEAVGWVAGYQEAARRGRPVRPQPAGAGHDEFPPYPEFAPAEHARFPHTLTTTVEGLIATLATHSWALVSEPTDRDAAFTRIRNYLAARPETARGSFALPLVASGMRALRR